VEMMSQDGSCFYQKKQSNDYGEPNELPNRSRRFQLKRFNVKVTIYIGRWHKRRQVKKIIDALAKIVGSLQLKNRNEMKCKNQRTVS
jgi:glycosyltransferase involved in cell wall biosynthesis